MQQPNSSASSANSASFASLLATLSNTSKKAASGWGDEELSGDAAPLSYEHALRAHARYKPEIPEEVPQKAEVSQKGIDQSLTQIPDSPDFSMRKTATAASAPIPVAAPEQVYSPYQAVSDQGMRQYPSHSRRLHARLERNRLRASVTIRMSDEESEQLRLRAAEAGVTVSAYLRSCTFEAEALRAQVKDALTQLRSAGQPMKNAAVEPERQNHNRGSWRNWFSRLWPRSTHRATTG